MLFAILPLPAAGPPRGYSDPTLSRDPTWLQELRSGVPAGRVEKAMLRG